MPNWCENRVTFSGPEEDVEEIKELIGTDEQPISFQKIKPMPKALELSHGSSLLGYEALYETEKVLGYLWVKEAGIASREELIQYFRENHPEDLELARRYKSNVDQYGFTDWYGWRIHHWGTKWDVSPKDIEVMTDEPGILDLLFHTPWSPPAGIHDALIALIDDHGLDVQLTWFYNEPALQIAGYL